MRRELKLLFLGVAAIVLAYGVAAEQHQVRSLADDSITHLSGPQFIESATVDGFTVHDGFLYDVYSLSPLEASEKDCKT
jgi:hypothetical protein